MQQCFDRTIYKNRWQSHWTLSTLHTENSSRKPLCWDMAYEGWQENSKQCLFIFFFLSHWPSKNFGDLSHRVPQRNKEKRKLLCLFYLNPSEWLLFDGVLCVCVCAGLKGWEQSILNGTVIWRAGEYINIAFGMHFPLNKVSEQVYLLGVYYWHFHYNPSNTKLFQRTYDSE